MSASAKQDMSQVDQAMDNFRLALMRCRDDLSQKILSADLVRSLLMSPWQSGVEGKSNDDYDACQRILGLPRRPYYPELARRIMHVSGGDDPLLPAEDLGMSELPSIKNIRVPPKPEYFRKNLASIGSRQLETKASCEFWG